jgi:hypothetical protein
MRRRDHPQIGDIWANSSNNIIWTILNKEYDKHHEEWKLTVLIGGNANGDEGKIKMAYFDKDFSELEGIYWKVA